MNKPILSWTVGLTAVAALAAVGAQWLRAPEPVVVPQQPVAASGEKAFAQSDVIRKSEADWEEPQAIGHLGEDLIALRTQLTRLAQEQRAMRRQLDSLPESTLPGPESDPMGPDPAAQTDARVLQQQTLLDDSLRSEAVDAEWAESTLARIEEGFHREQLAGIQLIDAACASTLCQVELSIGPDLGVEESVQRLSLHRPWDGPTFFSMATDGTARFYFARDGYDLPGIPQDPDVM